MDYIRLGCYFTYGTLTAYASSAFTSYVFLAYTRSLLWITWFTSPFMRFLHLPLLNAASPDNARIMSGFVQCQVYNLPSERWQVDEQMRRRLRFNGEANTLGMGMPYESGDAAFSGPLVLLFVLHNSSVT
jgi:hypothetical protein